METAGEVVRCDYGVIMIALEKMGCKAIEVWINDLIGAGPHPQANDQWRAYYLNITVSLTLLCCRSNLYDIQSALFCI